MQPNLARIIRGLQAIQGEVQNDDAERAAIDDLIAHLNELERKVVMGFRARADMQGYKDRKRVDAQADFLAGAIAVLNEVTPSWYVACIRGELL